MKTRKNRLPIGSTFTYGGRNMPYYVNGQVVNLETGMVGKIVGRKSFQEGGAKYMDYDVEFSNGVSTTFIDFLVEPRAI